MTSSTRRNVLKASLAVNAALPLAALTHGVFAASNSATPAASGPQTREMYVTMVPMLTHEMATTYPFLTKEFAKGGLLDGKEIYGFMPSTLIAFAGDTLNIHIFNPTDDPHTFTIMELSQSITLTGESTGPFVLKDVAAGIYTLMCVEAEHMPYMWGQIVILPALV